MVALLNGITQSELCHVLTKFVIGVIPFNWHAESFYLILFLLTRLRFVVSSILCNFHLIVRIMAEVPDGDSSFQEDECVLLLCNMCKGDHGTGGNPLVMVS